MPQTLQTIEYPIEEIVIGSTIATIKSISEYMYIAPLDGFWSGGVRAGGNVKPSIGSLVRLNTQFDYVSINNSYTKVILLSLIVDPLQEYIYIPPAEYKHKNVIRCYPISDYSYVDPKYISRGKLFIEASSDYKLLGSHTTSHTKVNIKSNSDYYFLKNESVNDKVIIKMLSESSYNVLNAPRYIGRSKIRMGGNSTYFYESYIQGKSIIRINSESSYVNISSPAFIALTKNTEIEIQSETVTKFEYPYNVPVVIEDAGVFLNSVIDLIYEVVSVTPEDVLDIPLPIWAVIQNNDLLDISLNITATLFNRVFGECLIKCDIIKKPKYDTPVQIPGVSFTEWG